MRERFPVLLGVVKMRNMPYSLTLFVFQEICVYNLLLESLLILFKPQNLQLRCQQTVMRVSPGRQVYKEKN